MKNDKADRIVKELQGDLPLVSRPYLEVAERTGLTEQEVLATLARFMQDGRLRRVGAVLRHQRVGYDANALVAWKVPEEEMDRAGSLMAANSKVSHCYWRETPADFPYNLFTMIHGQNREDLEVQIQELALAAGIGEYKVIESVRELKKTSVKFVED